MKFLSNFGRVTRLGSGSVASNRGESLSGLGKLEGLAVKHCAHFRNGTQKSEAQNFLSRIDRNRKGSSSFLLASILFLFPASCFSFWLLMRLFLFVISLSLDEDMLEVIIDNARCGEWVDAVDSNNSKNGTPKRKCRFLLSCANAEVDDDGMAKSKK
jgi:hypothetical protein